MAQSILYGRKSEDGDTQPLRDHLLGAGRLAQSFEQEYSDLAYAAAVLHDIGKASDDFQAYLLNNQGERGSVHHAIHGALLTQQSQYQTSQEAQLANAILALAIAKHHGELPDCIFRQQDQYGANSIFEVFAGKIPQVDQDNFTQVRSRLDELQLDVDQILQQAASNIQEFHSALAAHQQTITTYDQVMFYYGLLVKYIYSRLVDADRLDAAAFTMPASQREHALVQTQPDWEAYIQKLADFTSTFDTASPINRVRTSIYSQCQESSQRETGIYQLAVPTGGGKTLASLNFALHHAKQWNKRRIIYVIPYLSITTQTAQVFRSVFNLDAENAVLLEHYSSADSYRTNSLQRAVETGQRDDESLLEKLAAERWDSPIIVTTMVQFLETVMSAQGTKLRKFHNMADSIIIFDEIQALPTNTINLFNEIVSFLSNILHTTIVLCSATQPHLMQSSRHNLALSAKPNLVHLNEQERQVFRRTQIIASQELCSIEEFAEHVLESARTHGNCLAVVNLKNEAKKVLAHLKSLHAEDEFTLVHLSTNMCNAHRTDKIAFLNKQLATKDARVICVSTQLIEAGVDISFRSVVRATAGLDSIIQAAGRCNRNGESDTSAPVFVYSLKDEHLDNLPTIQVGKGITEQILRQHPEIDLLSNRAIDLYYNILFDTYKVPPDMNSIMDYEFRQAGGTRMYAYSALGFNLKQRGEYYNATGKQYNNMFAQAFATVGEHFRVIKNAGQSVVVPYSTQEDQECKPLTLIQQLADPNTDKSEKLAILRQLQPYTIILFDYEIRKLEDEHALTTQEIVPNSNFTIRYIDIAHYSDDIGITYDITPEMMMF